VMVVVVAAAIVLYEDHADEIRLFVCIDSKE
jgi:hypothetical protein